MWLNGLLCLADIPVFFLSIILLIMSLFKPKNGDDRVQDRRFESGCWGIFLFVFIAMFAICNWASLLIKFLTPGDTDIIKISGTIMIFGSITIMILTGRGDAYQTASNRVLFILSIISMEGTAGATSAILGASIGQIGASGNVNQIIAYEMRAFYIGLLISLAVGIFFMCINLILFRDFNINGLIIISWLVAAFAGGAIGGTLYGRIWGGLAGGIIGIISGIISLRKFISKDYQEFLKFEELSSRIRKWS
jgi:hypothetical protein